MDTHAGAAQSEPDHRHPQDGRPGAVTPVPGSIVTAICAVMAATEAVTKSNKNVHGGYMYASTDDIYAAVTRKMGEVGLIVLALEDRCEIVRIEKEGKVAQWANMVFSFVLATPEATWTDPRAKRTLYIQVTGAQTFQAAQSYAEKAYLRSLFKLPTGDMDLDSMPQAANEDDQVALAGSGRKRKSSAASKRDGTDALFNEIRTKIQEAATADLLQQIRLLYAEEWDAMPMRWEQILNNEYEDRMDSFGAREAAQ